MQHNEKTFEDEVLAVWAARNTKNAWFAIKVHEDHCAYGKSTCTPRELRIMGRQYPSKTPRTFSDAMGNLVLDMDHQYNGHNIQNTEVKGLDTAWSPKAVISYRNPVLYTHVTPDPRISRLKMR